MVIHSILSFIYLFIFLIMFIGLDGSIQQIVRSCMYFVGLRIFSQ